MNTEVHATQCCATHGCKYDDPDCPVVLGRVQGACGKCETDYFLRIGETTQTQWPERRMEGSPELEQALFQEAAGLIQNGDFEGAKLLLLGCLLYNTDTLTVNILRNWDRERIERFAKHLLGERCQECTL